MEKRVNVISLIIGTRGTGKTTFLKGDEKLKIDGLVDAYIDRDPKQKILIVDLFNNPVWQDIPVISIEKLRHWKSGMYRIYSNDESQLFSLLNKYVYNTVIIFEDSTKYVRHPVERNLNRLLIDSKQKNLDVFFAFHYLQAVPPDLVRIADNMVLFKTNETFNSQLRNKYPHPDIERAFKEVNAAKDFHFNKYIALI